MTRVARLLLRAYPRAFRDRYGAEWLELWHWRMERGRGSRTTRLVRLAWDALRGGLRERMGRPERMGAEPPPRNRTHGLRKGDGMMGRWTEDLREAARRTLRSPGFTLAAVAVVALGIGANTAVFTLVNAVLLRPPPFEEPDRLVRVYQDSDDGDPQSTSFPAYRDMAGHTDVFEAVAAHTPASLTWGTDDGPRPALVEFVTAGYLPVRGLRPALGRDFEPAHDVVGAGNYAIVSHRTWTDAFGADPGVVGSTVRFNGQPVTVIGVGPAGFGGGMRPALTDFWMSISSVGVGGDFRVANLDRRSDHWYDVLARLAPGVTEERAQAAMDALAARLAQEFPEFNRGRDITVFGLDEVRVHPGADGQLESAAGLLIGIVGLVLLLACTNLANLLLVRGISRSQEVAIRRALGAARARVARLFMLEAWILSSLGGILGVALAAWIASIVDGIPLPLVGTVAVDLSLDHRVLLFALALVAVTGTFFGLAPAVHASRGDVATTLREDRPSSSAGRSTNLLRNGLVAVQVAVSVVLLVAAGLLVRSFGNVRAADPGVDVDRLAFVGTDFVQAGVDAEEGNVLVREVAASVRGLPGVESVALATRLPVQNRGGSSTTVVEGYTPPSGTEASELLVSAVGPGYFETMGIPVVDGRAFGPDDRQDSERVVIVNETAARRFWPAGDAVGGRIRPQGAPDAWSRVVGVVGDTKIRSLSEPPTPLVYRPVDQLTVGSVYLVARTSGDARELLAPLRRELAAVRPTLTLTDLSTVRDLIDDGSFSSAASAALLGGFAGLAVLLASLGIYSVVSFTVARRSGEMGIRIALGAHRGRVVGRVVRTVLVTVALGLAAGLALARLAMPLLEDELFGVAPLDVPSFLAGAAILLTAALVAALVPARRAAGADPVEVLRAR